MGVSDPVHLLTDNLSDTTSPARWSLMAHHLGDKDSDEEASVTCSLPVPCQFENECSLHIPDSKNPDNYILCNMGDR